MEAADVTRLDLEMEWEPGHVAAYLVEGDGVVLVDVGVATDEGVDELRAEVREAGYEFADVDAVLVTHPHLDHDGAVPEVIEESGATVYAHENVPGRLDVDKAEGEGRDNVREAGIVGKAGDEALERWLDGVRRNAELLPSDAIDVLLSDGEEFEAAGVRFEAIHTPGHQADHLCYAADGALFAGDAVTESFRPVIFNVGFGDGMYNSVSACYDTFERLGEADADRVYPGHGPIFEDLGGAVKGSLSSLNALVEDVYATVEELDEPTALDVTVSRKKPEQDVGYVIFDNLGALGYLEDQGRVDSWLDGEVRRFSVSEA